MEVKYCYSLDPIVAVDPLKKTAADKAAADKAAADKAAADKAAADKAAADKAAADKAAVQQLSKLPADEVERRRKVLLSEINRIDNRTNAAVDNGLFDRQKEKLPQDAFEDIQNKLRDARNEL